MKLKNVFVLCLSAFLFACAPEPLDDQSYEAWRKSLQDVEKGPTGSTIVTKEKKVEQVDPSVVHVAKTQGDYMEVIARQFRQDLLSTGGQVKHDGSKVYVYIPAQSIFGSNQVTIKPSIETSLKAIAQNLKTHPETMIRIIGHTDNSMSVMQSRAFSLRQANVFANYMRSEGVSSERLLVEGYGSSDPIANNKTPEGRARNCYIEMIIYNLQ